MNRQQHLGSRNHFVSRREQRSLRGSILLLLWVLASCAGATNSPVSQGMPITTPLTPVVTSLPLSPTPSTAVGSSVHHYEYVFPDGGMDVYDIDHGFALVQHVSLPTSAGGGVLRLAWRHICYI